MGQNYRHQAYAKFKKQNPTRRYHASETSSATSSRGEYFFPVTTDPNDSRVGFQLSSYDMTTIGWGCSPEAQFKMNEEYPFMSGEFVWTGFDYIGEPTPYNKDLTNLLNFSDPKAVSYTPLLLHKTYTINSNNKNVETEPHLPSDYVQTQCLYLDIYSVDL